MTILTQKFNTKHNTAPFASIKNKDFKPSFKNNIKKAKTVIDSIINNLEPPTFENTIVALEFAGQELNRLSNIFFNLNAAETSDEIQKIAQDISPLLVHYQNDIYLNKKLFILIKVLFNQIDALNLAIEEKTILEKIYKGFCRNGALLNGVHQQKLRQIDTELAKLQLKFGENVLAETHNYQLRITNEKDLKGLPTDVVESAKMAAKSKNLSGWIFTLDITSYLPFVTYAENRDLRKELTIAMGKKSFQNNEFDNQKIILQITNLRLERAKLLGYKNHSEFILEERMAKNPEKVIDFLNDLLIKAKPVAEKEFAELTNFAKNSDKIEQLEKWDIAFYSEKLKNKLFDLDNEKLKPYFQLENVLNGMFTIAKKLYGLVFVEIWDIDKYHQDVKTYEVMNSENQLVAIFYADFFPRKGKQNGGWMTSFKPQYIEKGFNERPHISIVCNFTQPTNTKPSLLTFNEVTTLFHEFGHALHGMLANTIYPSLSGTSVYWDFVELPSQIMENWCYEPEALAIFAKHYQTNEIIPQEYIQKIKQTANFQQGITTLRQIGLGLLDMAFHGQNITQIKDIKSFEKKIMNTTTLYPDIPENSISTSFSHIFQGEYSSGYYSYKWAEVLDADAFEYFKEKGVFNEEIAKKFKNTVLSKGGTVPAMELYKQFRGKEPSIDALLKRSGLG